MTRSRGSWARTSGVAAVPRMIFSAPASSHSSALVSRADAAAEPAGVAADELADDLGVGSAAEGGVEIDDGDLADDGEALGHLEGVGRRRPAHPGRRRAEPPGRP